MAGYTKLFTSILDSTIWREPAHVRLVWITMLAMADKNGVVEASIPGLADRARVTLKECIDALDRLKSPDEHSRSTEFEGRRIEPVDGGWYLLNHSKYRDLVTLQERRAQDAERARRYRERIKERDASREITPPSPSPTPSPTSTTKKRGSPPKKISVPLPDTWQPNEGHLELAKKHGIDPAWEVEKFRDYAHSKAWKKIDWDATFRNWLRKCVEYGGTKGGDGQEAWGHVLARLKQPHNCDDPISFTSREKRAIKEAFGSTYDLRQCREADMPYRRVAFIAAFNRIGE